MWDVALTGNLKLPRCNSAGLVFRPNNTTSEEAKSYKAVARKKDQTPMSSPATAKTSTSHPANNSTEQMSSFVEYGGTQGDPNKPSPALSTPCHTLKGIKDVYTAAS